MTYKMYFLGFVEQSEQEKLFKIAKNYKCDLRMDQESTAVFCDNAFRIDSIRNKLWGHRWAINKDWVEKNPQLAGFDPRKCKKVKKVPS